MIRLISFLVILTILVSSIKAGNICGPEIKNLAQYVNPLIGTGGTGHTFPGAVTPYGMVQLSPDTGIGEWKRCSGYHATDSTIIGFSLTHLSGTGNADLGDVMLMPTIGEIYTNRGTSLYPDTTYRSRFRNETEKASPGYYSVFLDDYKILAELTASKRVGLHRYTFPTSDSVSFIMNFTHRVMRDDGEKIWSYYQYDDSTTLSGYSVSSGWAKDRRIYWTVKFSKPFNTQDDKVKSGKNIRAILNFTTQENEQIIVKTAYSPVSIANARLNLTEVSHWDFDTVKAEAQNAWNRELNKIIIDADKKTKTLFYTSMYHAMIHPSLFTDINGQYRGADNTVYETNKHPQHTIFSLWDTFRALHPLLTIIHPEKNRQFVYNMLNYYHQTPNKTLPVWELHGNETWTMIGYHAAPVITDAFLKGLIKEDDAMDFLKAMTTSATNTERPRSGITEYMQYGYVPVETDSKEPVSITLEYAFDDWCIAKMAEALGKKEIAEHYTNRSNNFKNVWDDNTRFMRGRDTEGNFATRRPGGEFDPLYFQWGGDYTEGNAWQYTWYVPHDVPALIALMGGNVAFEQKLDSLFLISSNEENEIRDVTGTIGQYAHGNEPSHHICYLYNYVQKPWKTQEKINHILNNFYQPERDGIIGNEDCGQMSAWYIFSSLGFYPVNPVSGVYVIGKPNVEKAIINVDNGNTFTIKTKNYKTENTYIKHVKLNGAPYECTWISHTDIIRGGELTFYMSDEPSSWGTSKNSMPVSSIY